MRYRLFIDRFMLFVDCDNEKRIINRVELEGELPLLVADTRHRSASLWVLTEDALNEWGFDALDYTLEEQNGETHIWKWYDAKGNVMLRVEITIQTTIPNETVGHLVVELDENDTPSLLTFMTNFAGWSFIETYGDIEKALTNYAVRLRDEKEREIMETPFTNSERD
jgi:hypothetical protein